MDKILELIKRRIPYIVLAAVLFVLEVYFLLGPTSWAGEPHVNWLAGEGTWYVEVKDDVPLVQEYVPQHAYLESMSLLFYNNEQAMIGGDLQVWLEDAAGEVVFETLLQNERVTWGSYTDIDVDVKLDAGKSYRLKILSHPSEDGLYAQVGVCSVDYVMPENKSLHHGDEIPATQLVSRYSYERALNGKIYLRVLAICGLTFLAVAMGVPKHKKIRRILAVALFLVTPLILGRQLEFISLVINESTFIPYSIHWNVGIMYMVELVFLLCSQSFKFSVIGSNLLFTLLYSADYFVRMYRETPLRWNDLTAARTAMNVMGDYDLTPNSHMAMSWILLILVVALVLQTGTRKNRLLAKISSLKKPQEDRFETQGTRSFPLWKEIVLRGASFAAGVALLLFSGHMLLYTDLLERMGFVTVHGFEERAMYQFNGYLVSACLDYKTTRVTKPEGYSEEAVQALLQEYTESGAQLQEGDLPHIILIMNESYADLRDLGNLEISEENMEFFYSLKENTIRGTVNTSVLGGGTANSEFEVFTGCSMGLFSRAFYPYQQGIKKPVDNLVSELKTQGYTTYSMHPETATNWNRDRVYRYLGFDNSYWIEDFEGADVIHKGVSDLETYRKVQELYENRQEGEKLFVFDLTIQNHGGYGEGDGYDSVKSVNAPSTEADNFLSLIKESDKALEELINYFENEDEKVIICMFGDHQPTFSDSDFYEDVFAQTEGISDSDRTLNKYITPFVIWANYDIPEEENINISLNYLGVLLQEAAGVEMSPYFKYLQDHMEEYPVITSNVYMDAEGKRYQWKGDKSEFPEYRILQYHRIYGD